MAGHEVAPARPAVLKLVLVIVLAAAALVASQAAAHAATSQHARRPARVSIAAANRVEAGAAMTLTGRVRRTSRPVRVELQQRSSDGWRTIMAGRTTTTGAYRFTIRPERGIWRYRVVKRVDETLRRAVSTTVRVTAFSRVALSARMSSTTLVGGETLTVTGGAQPAGAGSSVELQQWLSGAWVTVARAELSAAGAYRFDVAPAVGQSRYRVRKPSEPTLAGASSPSLQADVAHPCPPMPTPSALTTAQFARPGAGGPSPLTELNRGVFCAAAPGATIDIALFSARDAASPEVAPMLDALRWVVANRGVTVNVLLEAGTLLKSSSNAAMADVLDDFAQVTLCSSGCRSTGSGAIQHNKFVVVSDTIWAGAVDPAVVQTTANWGTGQLRRRHQSALLLWKEQALARELTIRFQNYRACGSAEGCEPWNVLLSALGLDSHLYGIDLDRRIWIDRGGGRFEGASGRGTRIFFSPMNIGDPIAEELERYDCGDGTSTIEVGHMFIASGRAAVIQALADAQLRGCHVSIVVDANQDFPAALDGIAQLQSHGLIVQCAPSHHDKFILIEGVDPSTGVKERTLLTGSHNLGHDSLRRNDEVLLRLSDAAIGDGTAQLENAAVWQQYRAEFSELVARSQPCSVS